MQQLRVEHRRQGEAAGCLAACAQMVLQFIGLRQSQQELNRLLGLMQVGTPSSHIQRLNRLGVTVVYSVGDEGTLRKAIEQGVPPIVFLSTGDLPHWNVDLRHAVVVIGYSEEHIFLNDPAFAESPKQVNWGDFCLPGASLITGTP